MARAVDVRVIAAALWEGLATRYEFERTGQISPWGVWDPAEADQWIEELMALPVGIDRHPWRFEHPDGRRWVCYRAGTRIVERATANSARSAADLFKATTDERR